MRVVLDASVLISAFKENEPEHSASADFLEAAVAHSVTLCSPALLFPEIAGAFARPGRNPDYAARAIREMRALLEIGIYPLDADLALNAEAIAQNFLLRGADAFYVALARRLGAALITLDREMLERATPVAEVFTPAAWLEASKGRNKE